MYISLYSTQFLWLSIASDQYKETLKDGHYVRIINDVDSVADLSSYKHGRTTVTLSSLTYSLEFTIYE